MLPMTIPGLLLSCSLLVASIPLAAQTHGAGPVLIAYGGFNETMAPMWVGVEKGLFKKHGVDARVLQTRRAQIMMATLATGGASLVWAAPSSALNSSACGKGRQGKTGKFRSTKSEIRNNIK
jgi:taurine transport system substrate-binding protein